VRPQLIDGLDPARVCAALAPLIAPERRARIEVVLAARLSGLTVVLENLSNPHNGAAAVRSCEAAGVQAIHVIEGRARFRFSPKVTQGCQRWLDLTRYRASADAVRTLRAGGFVLAAALPEAEKSLDALDGAERLALCFGNEHTGLSEAVRAAADLSFALPMVGMTRSLNLSVAVALAVNTAAARRREALRAGGDLDPAARAALRARWYAADVRGAEAVLRRAGVIAGKHAG